ncbi:MAG TPA: protoglobin domain-containing protein [Polyangiaceae bacterium]|nr:protoglobin domain-containing protein [Polyangiaceae bacterium]
MSADGEAELCSEKENNIMNNIPGYTHGTLAVGRSPVTVTDFNQMKASALFSDEDVKYLRMSYDIVKDRIEAILDVWYGFIGSQVLSTVIVPFRDLFALIFPVTFTLRPFLAQGGHAADEVEKMYAAWVKSCLLQVTLWSHPYVKEGDF